MSLYAYRDIDIIYNILSIAHEDGILTNKRINNLKSYLGSAYVPEAFGILMWQSILSSLLNKKY